MNSRGLARLHVVIGIFLARHDRRPWQCDRIVAPSIEECVRCCLIVFHPSLPRYNPFQLFGKWSVFHGRYQNTNRNTCTCALGHLKPWADLKACTRFLGSHAIPQPCSEKQSSTVNQCMAHSWWYQLFVRIWTNLVLAVRSFVRVAERAAIGADCVIHSRVFKELPVSGEHRKP